MKTGMTRGLRYFAMVSVAVVALTAGERGAQAGMFSALKNLANKADAVNKATFAGNAQAMATQGLTKALVGAATGAVSKSELKKAAVKVAVAAAGAAILPIATSKINDALGTNLLSSNGKLNTNVVKGLAAEGLTKAVNWFSTPSGDSGAQEGPQLVRSNPTDPSALDRTEEDSALWRETSPSDGGPDEGERYVAQAADSGCMDYDGCDGEPPEGQAVADAGPPDPDGYYNEDEDEENPEAVAAADGTGGGGGTGGGRVAVTSGMSRIQNLFQSNPLAGITGGKGDQCSCVPTWTTGAT